MSEFFKNFATETQRHGEKQKNCLQFSVSPCLCGKKKGIWWDQCGFTTVELLVALQIALLVGGITGGMFIFYQKIHKDWVTRNRLVSAALVDMTHLADTARRACRITAATDGRLELQDEFDRARTYRLRDSRLYRDGACLTPDGISVGTLLFTLRSNDVRLDRNLDGNVDMDELDRDSDGALDGTEARGADLLDIRAVYAAGAVTYEAVQTVHLRTPGAAI